MNPNLANLDKILSDFKVPRRKLELDAPVPIDEIKGNQDQVYDEVLNNDYLAFTRNLKIAKTVPLNDQEKLQQDELVYKVYNFEYRPNPDSKTDYDILKEGYELLYAVYLEQKRSLNNIVTDHMKLGAELSYLKNDIQVILKEIQNGIKTAPAVQQLDKLRVSIREIDTSDAKYIQKLKKAIDSNILTERERINTLYELLEIPQLEIPQLEK